MLADVITAARKGTWLAYEVQLPGTHHVHGKKPYQPGRIVWRLGVAERVSRTGFVVDVRRMPNGGVQNVPRNMDRLVFNRAVNGDALRAALESRASTDFESVEAVREFVRQFVL